MDEQVSESKKIEPRWWVGVGQWILKQRYRAEKYNSWARRQDVQCNEKRRQKFLCLFSLMFGLLGLKGIPGIPEDIKGGVNQLERSDTTQATQKKDLSYPQIKELSAGQLLTS